MKTNLSVGCFLALSISSTAIMAEPPRTVSLILQSPIVWPNSNTREMLNALQYSGPSIANFPGGQLPYEWQRHNKQSCAAETLGVNVASIDLKIGETFAIKDLIFTSSAFGNYYFDAAMTRRWKFTSDAAVLETKPAAVLRAVAAGSTQLSVTSLCAIKGLKAPATAISIPVHVEAAE